METIQLIKDITLNLLIIYLVAVQKRVAFDTSDFRSLLSYNKCIRNSGFQTFPVHLRNSLGGFIHGLSSKSPPTLF